MLISLRSARMFAMQVSRTAVAVVFGFSGAALADTAEGLAFLEEGDVAAAASSFQAAFQAGDGDGAFYLGRLVETGSGVAADPVRAANLYAAGVEKGSVLAMNRLGVMYQDGNVLLRDYAEAARLMCQAAEAGDANGQFNCAMSYFDGRGVDKDVTKAVSLWEQAAEAGNTAAQNALGQIWLTGDDAAGIEADPVKARGYFEATADAGNGLGLFRLAQLDAQPGEDNKPANAVSAYKFASLAAVRGVQEAGLLRDRLEAEMNSADILAAQAEAKAWTEAQLTAADADTGADATDGADAEAAEE